MANATVELMKAVAIARFGSLDELKFQDVTKPEPAPGEVLIRIHAAGVGIWDSLQRQGEMGPDHPHFPLVLGGECAGEIERLGANVTSLKIGDPVYTYFNAKQGAYSQYVAVKADMVAAMPTSLSFIEAAAAPVDAITAHQAIVDELKLKSGEWFYVAGGAGGVGMMAVQLAVNIGARVIASASAESFAFLESLGVSPENLVDYKKSDVVRAVRLITGGTGVDAAIDAVGGEHSKETFSTVRDGGRIAELTGEDLPKERNVTVFHIFSKPSAKRLNVLADLFDAGKLKVRVGEVFALSEARKAQAAVEHPHGSGKIVLRVV